MIKVEWIKIGDVIEVDGKEAKLISIVEDLTYTDLYTFKREDGSKFHWRHENIYRYVMDRHIGKLESLLCEEKQRADAADAKWERFKERLERESKEAFGEGYTIDWQIYESLIEVMDDLERGEE